MTRQIALVVLAAVGLALLGWNRRVTDYHVVAQRAMSEAIGVHRLEAWTRGRAYLVVCRISTVGIGIAMVVYSAVELTAGS